MLREAGIDPSDQGTVHFVPEPLDEILEKFGSQMDILAGKGRKLPGEAVGWAVNCATEWQAYCRTQHIYEYPTAEYIKGLSTYLEARAAQVGEQTGQAPRILEVAAGQGRLSFLLAKQFELDDQPAEFYPIDDFSWMHSKKEESTAEPIDTFSALLKYQPHIVIGAWLPYGESTSDEWTGPIRHQPTVTEYILIGNPHRHAGPLAWQKRAYRSDDFERYDLRELNPHQLCWEDFIMNDRLVQRSRTVSFRREAPSSGDSKTSKLLTLARLTRN